MKSELLSKIAARGDTHTTMLAMAAKAWTADAAADRFKELERRRAIYDKSTNRAVVVLWGLAMVAFSMLIFPDFMKEETASKTVWAGATVMVAFFSFVLSVMVVHLCALPVQLYWSRPLEESALTPIAGTLQCEYSLRDLEHGGPWVAQWRDIALAERGQLHRMDARIMSALRTAYEAEQSEATRQSELDLACRKLHGLAPAATL